MNDMVGQRKVGWTRGRARLYPEAWFLLLAPGDSAWRVKRGEEGWPAEISREKLRQDLYNIKRQMDEASKKLGGNGVAVRTWIADLPADELEFAFIPAAEPPRRRPGGTVTPVASGWERERYGTLQDGEPDWDAERSVAVKMERSLLATTSAPPGPTLPPGFFVNEHGVVQYAEETE